MMHRLLLVIALTIAVTPPAWAQKRYGPGATDTTIKVGQTMAYSGPISALGTHGRAMAAYFAEPRSRESFMAVPSGKPIHVSNMISLPLTWPYERQTARPTQLHALWTQSRPTAISLNCLEPSRRYTQRYQRRADEF